MVKYKFAFAFLIITLFCLFSCGSFLYKKNSYGVLRMNVERFSIKNIDQNIVGLVDTNAIYRIHASFMLKNKDDSRDGYEYYQLKENDTFFGYVSYIKFYKKGRLGYFSISKNDSLNSDYFNPLKGAMGVYGYKNNKLMTEVLLRGDGSGFILKQNLRIDKDTLFFVQENGYGSVYTKVKNTKPLKNVNEPDW